MEQVSTTKNPFLLRSIHATLDVTITGGTGRFAGATGHLTGFVNQSIITPAGDVSFDGTISY